MTVIASLSPPCNFDVNVDVRGTDTALRSFASMSNAKAVLVHCMAESGVRIYVGTVVPLGNQGESAWVKGPKHLKTSAPLAKGVDVNNAATPMPVRRKMRNWTNATLCDALDAITDDGIKVKATSRKFGIPTSSLRDHLLGKTTSRQRDNPPTLKLDEEKKLVDYIFKM